MNKRLNNNIKYCVVPVLALLVFLLTQILTGYPMIVERYYSRQLYPVIATILSFFSRWVPFSIDDLFYFLLIISGFLIILFLVIRKMKLISAAFLVMNVLAAVYITFYFFWGFNYFRADLNSRLKIQSTDANSEEFMKVFSSLVEAANETFTTYDDFNKEKTALLIEDSYRKFAPVLNLDYPSGTRKPKNITLSRFFAQAGISGYFGPFFNEVQVNSNLLPVEYPFVLAHEKAHQFGITGESEANFYAWLVCTKSSSQQLQYSANLVALRYFFYHGHNLEGYREVVSKLDKRVIDDIKAVQQHWLSLQNEKVEAVASKVNDAYLKTNRVEKGIRDYTGIVKHIMDYSLDSAFQRKADL